MKPIHEQRLAAETLRPALFGTGIDVRQEMEGLEPSWVCEVGRISMRCQRYVSVGCVCHGEVGNEVVEATIVRLSNEGNLLKDTLGGLCRFRRH